MTAAARDYLVAQVARQEDPGRTAREGSFASLLGKEPTSAGDVCTSQTVVARLPGARGRQEVFSVVAGRTGMATYRHRVGWPTCPPCKRRQRDQSVGVASASRRHAGAPQQRARLGRYRGVISDGERTSPGECHARSTGPVSDLERLRRALARLLESRAQALERSEATDRALVHLRSKDWVVALTLSVKGNDYLILRRTSRPLDLSTLSARELAVVRHACAGRSNKEIAHEMGISNATVRVLIFRACRKFKVASRARLIEALPQFTDDS